MTRSSVQATAAFYNTSPATRLFRWGLRLAVRAAYRLFGTPRPPRWLNRRRDGPVTGPSAVGHLKMPASRCTRGR